MSVTAACIGLAENAFSVHGVGRGGKASRGRHVLSDAERSRSRAGGARSAEGTCKRSLQALPSTAVLALCGRGGRCSDGPRPMFTWRKDLCTTVARKEHHRGFRPSGRWGSFAGRT